MYRITLKNVLPAALLFAGASAFAADNDVTLNGTRTTWASVVTALNSTADLEALQAEKDAADKAVADFTGDKTEYVPVAWLADVEQQAKTFAAAYDEAVNDGESEVTEPTFFYKIGTSAVSTSKTFYIAFTQYSSYNATTPSAFIKSVLSENGNKFASLRIYLGKDYAKNNGFIIVNDYTLDLENFGTYIQTQVESIAEDPAYGTSQNTAAYQALLDAQKAAEAAVKAASADTPKTISLQGDVTVDEIITTTFTGTINGNGYTFTAPSGVFADFNGSLSNAAVNGVFAQTEGSEAKFTNVAMWDAIEGKGAWYPSTSTVDTKATTFGAIAFAGRARFGVNNGKFVPATDNNKVYSIQVYNKETPGAATYVTYDGTAFTNLSTNRTVPVGKNVFVESETADLNVPNVFYKNGEDYLAHSIEITDGVDFFCPQTIDAAEVTYTRNFIKGLNSLCLPFAVSSSNFDGATVELSEYSAVTDDKFVFVKKASVPANTPMLVNADGPCKISASNINVEATTTQIVESKPAGAYGLLAATSSADINKTTPNAVFGLTGDGTFKYAAAGNDFAAFRMVVTHNFTPSETTVSRGIIFLEPIEEGMTGIESVEGDAEAFSVAGGAGEIVINASAELGNVAVYAIDGRVAANAYVTAGETSVNVPAGLYIVNGKKVVVK